MKPKVLVIDDEKNIRRTLNMILTGEGYAVRVAPSGDAGLDMLAQSSVDLVILDVNLPGMDGIEVLGRIKERTPGTEVIMISGEATVRIAVDAARAGAFDFLEKPLSKDRVLIAVRNALAHHQLAHRVQDLESDRDRRRCMIGDSQPMRLLRERIAKVAATPATVLITGESGTGKEMVARALHEESPRRGQPFVKVNCAAIPEELIESEFFGCVRGAYTGADRDRDGKFVLADGGTILLDEVGDMSPKVQAKVLRVLQDGEIQRVGDDQVTHVDVRVVAATNKDLPTEVAAGQFREDLFHRLNVVPLQTPPLRERGGDLPALCRHFLELYAEENGVPVSEVEPAAMERLTARPWSGNVRELGNAMERLAILSTGPTISADDVDTLVPVVISSGSAASSWGDDGPFRISPEVIQQAGGLVPLRQELERVCIAACLDASSGNVSEAARKLAVERSNLYKKMVALGMATSGNTHQGGAS